MNSTVSTKKSISYTKSKEISGTTSTVSRTNKMSTNTTLMILLDKRKKEDSKRFNKDWKVSKARRMNLRK
jgi:hypothetical protein